MTLPEQSVIHHSRIDTWLLVVLVTAFILGAIVTVAAAVEGKVSVIIPAMALPLMAGLFLWLPFTIRYEIGGGSLLIRFGPFRREIPVESIREVQPSRNPLSAPAASLDRLRIDYAIRGGHRYMLVSPKNNLAFLEDLATGGSGLRVEGDRLKRE